MERLSPVIDGHPPTPPNTPEQVAGAQVVRFSEAKATVRKLCLHGVHNSGESAFVRMVVEAGRFTVSFASLERSECFLGVLLALPPARNLWNSSALTHREARVKGYPRLDGLVARTWHLIFCIIVMWAPIAVWGEWRVFERLPDGNKRASLSWTPSLTRRQGPPFDTVLDVAQPGGMLKKVEGMLTRYSSLSTYHCSIVSLGLATSLPPPPGAVPG